MWIDYNSGGLAIREDYTCSLFWRRKDSDGLVLGGRKRLPFASNHVVVNPFEKEAAVALTDGRLAILNEEAKAVVLVENVHCDTLTYGTSAMVLMATSRTELLFLDVRAKGSVSFRLPIQERCTAMTPCNSAGMFALSGNEHLKIFDLRWISIPSRKHEWRYITGQMNVPWMNWLDSRGEDLIIFDSPHSLMYVDSVVQTEAYYDLKVAQVKLEQPIIGMFAAEGHVSLLGDDLNIFSLCKDEIFTVDKIHPIPSREHRSSAIIRKTDELDRDQMDMFIRTFSRDTDYSMETKDDSGLDFVPLPGNLPPICNLLAKHWSID